MAIITESALQAYSLVTERLEKSARNRRPTRTAARTSVFLSHSHKDADLVKSAINFLSYHAVDVYVDWLDTGMPEVTSPETAARIRNAIAVNSKFVLLATERSLASRWVPWELGIADGSKKLPHTAVFPVRSDIRDYSGSEYLDLYSRIVIAEGGTAAVFAPGKTTDGILLTDWLNQ